MNGVIGMTGLLLNTDLTSDQRDYVETIHSSGEALLTIINEILDFSKIEAGKLDLEQAPFDLRDCVEESLDLLASRAAEKSLNLAYWIDESVPNKLVGDVTRLRQILVNLLSNAIKFTEKGEIIISVISRLLPLDPGQSSTVTSERPQIKDEEPGTKDQIYELHFTVRDTGIGIPPERMDRLFQAFSQGDTSTTRKYGGTGLGLVISKRLSELMGGTIWVESQGTPGQGSTFHFTIQTRIELEQRADNVNNKPARSVSLQTQPDLQLAKQHPLHILLVEDNIVNQKVALHLLEQIGYQADLASNGLEAIQSLQQQEYDVVLMDIQMPEMDGLEASQHICQTWPPDRRPRLIALTAHAIQGDQEQCFEAGMDDYISKPVHLEALMRALSQCRPISDQFHKEAGEMSLDDSTRQQETLPAPLSPEVLDTLRRTIGLDTPEGLIELIRIYLEDSPVRLAKLQQGVVQEKPEEVKLAAHSLRSTSATFGALRLAGLCQELEVMARSGRLAGASEKLGLVQAEFERVKSALNDLKAAAEI
jgi:CheY-like chemotaxis protein/HPt (histidine-containing phosphotransfer) domain-containing protein